MKGKRTCRSLIALLGLGTAVGVLPLPVAAQSQAPGGRTVFKCEAGGRITYTDAPCPGADKVGALRLHGVNRPIPDRVAHTAAADTLTGVSGVPSGTSAVRNGFVSRTFRFPPSANPECPHLAQRMARVEAEEQVATSQTIGMIQERLAVQRHWFEQLGCGVPGDGAPSTAATHLSKRTRAGYAG
jgi:hypothetical protein